MSSVEFPTLPTDSGDEESDRFCQMLNWQAERIAVTHAMVSEMYTLFEQLKPLVSGMPKMPAGMVMPPMMPGRR